MACTCQEARPGFRCSTDSYFHQQAGKRGGLSQSLKSRQTKVWGCLKKCMEAPWKSLDPNPRLSSYTFTIASRQQVALLTLPDCKARVTGQAGGNQQPGRWLSVQV